MGFNPLKRVKRILNSKAPQRTQVAGRVYYKKSRKTPTSKIPLRTKASQYGFSLNRLGRLVGILSYHKSNQ
jgi:hypothetical protein